MHLFSRISLTSACAAGLLAIAAGVAMPARATTLAQLTVDQMTDASDLIVRGTVDSITTDLDPEGRVTTYVELKVTESLKGNAAVNDYVTVETPGGVMDGSVADVPLAARYSEGEDVLVFLDEKRHGTAFGTVGMYLGKYTIKPNPADGAPMVVRFTVPWHQTFDARFVPNPPKAERQSLQMLEDGVRARVSLGWDGQPIPGASTAHLREINHLQPGVR